MEHERAVGIVAAVLMALAVRAVARRLPWDTTQVGAYGLLLMVLAIAALLVSPNDFSVAALAIGVAGFAGLYGFGASADRQPPTTRDRLVSAGAASALVLLVAGVALAEPWWAGVAALGLLAILAAILGAWESGGTGNQSVPAAPLGRAPGPTGLPARPAALIQCPSCGFSGRTSATRSVTCPRCRTSVRISSAPDQQPVLGDAGRSSPAMASTSAARAGARSASGPAAPPANRMPPGPRDAQPSTKPKQSEANSPARKKPAAKRNPR